MDEARTAGMAASEMLSQSKINFEVFYNQFSPFYYAIVLYVVAFVLGVWPGSVGPAAAASVDWLLCFTFALHTFALVARIYISGRPPVTNLYSPQSSSAGPASCWRSSSNRFTAWASATSSPL